MPTNASATFWDDAAIRCEVRDHFHAVYAHERGSTLIEKSVNAEKSPLHLSPAQAAQLDRILRGLALTEVKGAPPLPPGGSSSLAIDRSQAPRQVTISPHYQGDYHRVTLETWTPLIEFLRSLK